MSTYVDIRATYVVQTFLPLVRNFYPYVEQQPDIGQPADLYRLIALPYIPPYFSARKEVALEGSINAFVKELKNSISVPSEWRVHL